MIGTLARALAVVTAAALLAAAPGGATLSADQTTVAKRYLGSLVRHDYAGAYAVLTSGAQRYFRSAANFASIWKADSVEIKDFAFTSVRRGERGVVVFAKERISFLDHAHQRTRQGTFVVPYGLVREGAAWHVKDPFHPWKAFAPNVSAQTEGLRVTLRKVSFFSRRIEIVASFANLGEDFITVLPYGRTVVRDDRGGVYRALRTRDWSITDRRLFLGLRLAPNEQYTGALNFEGPPSEGQARTLSMTVAPALREGGDAPFDVVLPAIAVSAAGS